MEKTTIEKFNEIMNDVKTNGDTSKYLKEIGDTTVLCIDFDNLFRKYNYPLIYTSYFWHKTFVYSNDRDGDHIIILYKTLDKVIDIVNSRNVDDISSLFDCENSDCFSIDEFIAMINAMLKHI